MKIVLRKVTAAFMALTLLGAGTTFTNTVCSKPDVLTAVAADTAKIKCTCHGQYVRHDTLSFSYKKRVKEVVESPRYRYETYYWVRVESGYDVTYCRACGEIVDKTQTYYREYRI